MVRVILQTRQAAVVTNRRVIARIEGIVLAHFIDEHQVATFTNFVMGAHDTAYIGEVIMGLPLFANTEQ